MVKNFTDEEYRIYNLDLGLIGFIEQVYAPPRQVWSDAVVQLVRDQFRLRPGRVSSESPGTAPVLRA